MSRYRRYDGGDPLAAPVDLAEALDHIGQDVMAGYSPERAMREFLRRGGQDQRGLDDLARQVAERRRDILRRNNLDGTMQQVRELLDKAVLAERGQLARDVVMDDDDRTFREIVRGDGELCNGLAHRYDADIWRSGMSRLGRLRSQEP